MTSSPAPDLDELERLAKAAVDAEANPRWVTHDSDGSVSRVAVVDPHPLWDLNAAASPDAILALITELRAAREAAAPTPLAPPAGISPVETAGHSSPAARSAAGPDVAAETVAGWFHEAYERLAPDYGYRTRKASAVPWADVPLTNRALMVRVAAEVLALLATPPARSDHGASGSET